MGVCIAWLQELVGACCLCLGVLVFRRGQVALGCMASACPMVARSEDDQTAWWMTGMKDQIYFYVLYKSTMHGQVRLQKMAGDLQDCIIIVLCCFIDCFVFR